MSASPELQETPAAVEASSTAQPSFSRRYPIVLPTAFTLAALAIGMAIARYHQVTADIETTVRATYQKSVQTNQAIEGQVVRVGVHQVRVAWKKPSGRLDGQSCFELVVVNVNSKLPLFSALTTPKRMEIQTCKPG